MALKILNDRFFTFSSKIIYRMVILSFLLMIISCKNSSDPELEWALKQADGNRPNLEKVLNYYAHDEKGKNLEKYEAAYFLITQVLPFEKYIISSQRFKIDLLHSKLKNHIINFEKFEGNSLAIRNDITSNIIKEFERKNGEISNFKNRFVNYSSTISSKMLYENIEYAFKAWDYPWAKKYNFQEFCKYILPFNIGNQRPDNWRQYFFNELRYFCKSQIKKKEYDPIKVCNNLNKFLIEKDFMWSIAFDHSPHIISGKFMYESKIHGNCQSISNLAIEMMRSIGLPVTEVLYNKYGHIGRSHQADAILSTNGDWLLFEAISSNPVGETKPGASATKIYVKEGINLKDFKNKAIRKIGLAGYKDITSSVTKSFNIKVLKTNSIPSETKIAYLCIFNRDYKEGWEPIDWTEQITDENLSFDDIGGKNVIYLVMIEDFSGKLLPISDPFILTESGNQRYLNPKNKFFDARLTRKYSSKTDFLGQTLNGVFQVSNNKNFRNAINLYTINDTLRLIYHDITIVEKTPYRYFRYLFPKGSPGNISDIALYDENQNKLDGKIISDNRIEFNSSIQNAFDGNPLTFVYSGIYTDGQWIGLDLGSAKKISKLRFCPRTDKNDIWPMLNYELMYWDDKWVSLGLQKSKDFLIEYKDAPEGALFWLKNLSEGKEERIFTIEDGQQIWW